MSTAKFCSARGHIITRLHTQRRALPNLSQGPHNLSKRTGLARYKSTHTSPSSLPTGANVSPQPSSPLSQAEPVGSEPADPEHVSPNPFSAAQPPPRYHGAPRLIRYPPPESANPLPPSSNPSALYTYSRGPSSRLFSFYNAATAASTSLRTPFAYLPSASTSSAVSSYYPSQQQHPLREAKRLDTNMTSSVEESDALRKRNVSTVDSHVHNGHHEHKDDHHHGVASLFGHSHNHSHGAEGSPEEADKLLAALKGKGDRGSNITVVGLVANLVLCGAKGVAGVLLHSASLLADAAHSLSDTFSDIVTLFCWKMSQKPASISHPLGYGKFETMGGLGVSVVLVAGAFAIGVHSYGLLLEVLQPALQQMPSGLQAFGSLTGDLARAAGGLLHEHGHHAANDHAHSVVDSAGGAHAATHETANLLDPNAMWFALISVLVKEWLYRATLKIAREENSSVLEANAIHHRSDSLSSGVTFLAIGGSYLGFPVLDPLGGLLVAGLIGKQGAELLIGALADLSDRGVQPEVLDDFEQALHKVMNAIDEQRTTQSDGQQVRLLGWKDLRAVRSGVSTFVDVTLLLSENTRLKSARVIESRVREEIAATHKGVKEVRVRLDTHDGI